jgi:phosphopantothenoylcysteine decarboxylase / phosphopantothenate---cysteine ligase
VESSGPTGQTLIGKRIVLGVTGSIAAYKAVLLLRALLREGASVHVVMTQSAVKFVTPLRLKCSPATRFRQICLPHIRR